MDGVRVLPQPVLLVVLLVPEVLPPAPEEREELGPVLDVLVSTTRVRDDARL